MKDNKNWEKLNNQLKSMVDDVLDANNIKDLGEQMTKTVNAALSEASGQIQKAAGEVKSAGQSILKDIGSEINKTSYPLSREEKQNDQRQAHKISGYSPKNQPAASISFGLAPHRSKSLPAFRMKRRGSVTGPLLTFLGCFGFGFTLYQFLMGFIAFPPNSILTLLIRVIVCSVMFLLSGTLTLLGAARRKRLKRAVWYTKLCRNRPYINIGELAKLTNQKTKYILKDVRKMLKAGIFPEGHLDSQETCLMLNQNIYSQYLTLEKERDLREAEQASAKQIALKSPASPNAEPGHNEMNSELALLTAKGQAYIQKLQDLNAEIEGEIISTKLFKLENLIREIFDRVSSHPQQIPKMQRFMDYYLPTTLKLVQAYRDFDKVSVPGEDILSAKSEIEQTLETINQAFGELLNNLFRDVVYDITTDAKVLQSMLAREGLTEDMRKAPPTITE